MSKAALFLDRDGVINVDKGYVHKPEDCEFIDGIFDLVARAHAVDMLVIVVTNQAGIARGYYSEDQFQEFSTWMMKQFSSRGKPLDAIYHCPHHPSAGLGEYLRECDCRKPNPGMFLTAQKTYNLNMARSVMVGDTLNDIQAAFLAGVGHQWLIVQSLNSEIKEKLVNQDYISTLNITSSLRNIHL